LTGGRRGPIIAAALKESVPSRTAAWVAACRSLGALLPGGAQLVRDPFGMHFLGERTSRAVALLEAAPPVGRAILRASGPLLTSVLYMQVRTRVLDDALRAFAAAGGRQVVLLGAGYDCRAARFAHELAGGAPVTVFEVDHPATQAHKRRVLERLAPASLPVEYLPWNFESQPLSELADTLAAHGHQRGQQTFTIWEGVAMYLTEAAVDATVAAVRSYSAPGSPFAFTYFTPELLGRHWSQAGVLARVVARVGEPFRFGWAPEALPGWLGARGFGIDWDRDFGDAARELLPADAARHVPIAGRRSALARPNG
jgi:methyltransferase (TIGR00027 family)